MLTIKSRIIILAIFVFGVMLVLFSYLIYRGIRQAEISKLNVELESQAENIQTEIEEQIGGKVFPDMVDLTSVVKRNFADLRMQLYDTMGVVTIADSVLVALSQSGLPKTHLHLTSFQDFTFGPVNYRCIWFPVEADDRIQMLLLIAKPLTDIEHKFARLRTLLLLGIAVTLAVTALAAYFIIRRAFSPLTEIVRTARDISAQRLDQRVDVPFAKDEIRLLAETVNGMMDRIEEAFRTQKQFVADASHEIRTPLTVISTELEFALQRAMDEEVRTSLQISLSEIFRLSKMSDDLLLLARLDAFPTPFCDRPVRLDEVVVESVRLVSRLACSKGVQINLFVQDAVEVTGDYEQLKRMTINLLDNAVKYSAIDGKVEVALRIDLTNPAAARLIVADHGSGLTEIDRSKVFNRFFRSETARLAGDGTGLGLAIVKALVELHRGSISVDSALGQGSAFTVEFPIRTES